MRISDWSSDVCSSDLAVKYGATRDNVLGLVAVTGSGEVIRVGSNTTKDATGYDLTHLLVGSEGTLALIVEATLKLAPLPTRRASLREIGRASGRERVCQYVSISVVAVSLKKTEKAETT